MFSQDGSEVGFVGAKVTGKHFGGFKSFTGTIEVPSSRVEDARVEVNIDMASVFTDSEKLTGHLQSPEFFNVAQFPKARFVSTSVAKNADGTTTVTGDLTLHGVSKRISLPAIIGVAGETATAKPSSASIARTLDERVVTRESERPPRAARALVTGFGSELPRQADDERHAERVTCRPVKVRRKASARMSGDDVPDGEMPSTTESCAQGRSPATIAVVAWVLCSRVVRAHVTSRGSSSVNAVIVALRHDDVTLPAHRCETS